MPLACYGTTASNVQYFVVAEPSPQGFFRLGGSYGSPGQLAPMAYTNWAAARGLSGPVAAMSADHDADRIPNAFEWLFGANLREGEPMLRMVNADGRPAVEFPMQDTNTLWRARLWVDAVTNLASEEWNAPLMPVPRKADTPSGKQRFYMPSDAKSAYFRLRVEMIENP
jgi:hypothetical protein